MSALIWWLAKPHLRCTWNRNRYDYCSSSGSWHRLWRMPPTACFLQVVLQPEFVPRLAFVHQPACTAGSADVTIIELDVVMRIRSHRGLSRLTTPGCWTKAGSTSLLAMLARQIIAVMWTIATYMCRAIMSAASACSLATGNMRCSSSSATTDLHRSSSCAGSNQQPLPRLHLRLTFGVQDRAGPKLTGQVRSRGLALVYGVLRPFVRTVSWPT